MHPVLRAGMAVSTARVGFMLGALIGVLLLYWLSS
jgi:hypothetical protein